MREDKVLFQKKNLMQFVVRILIFFTKNDGIWRYNKHYKYINFIFLFLLFHTWFGRQKGICFLSKNAIVVW